MVFRKTTRYIMVIKVCTLHRGVFRPRSHDTSWSKIMNLTWPRGIENRRTETMNTGENIFVSCAKIECVTFAGKRKKGGNDNKKEITSNDNINDNTQQVQGIIITQK